MIATNKQYNEFLAELKNRVASSRYKAALSVNKELLLLYHSIGAELLKSQAKHGWDAKIVAQVSKNLKLIFPGMKGFSPRNLKYMCRFVEEYPDLEVVEDLFAELTWYHHVTLLEKVPNKETRLFFLKKAIEYGWSRNTMAKHIENALYKGQVMIDSKDKSSSPQSSLSRYLLSDLDLLGFLSVEKRGKWEKKEQYKQVGA